MHPPLPSAINPLGPVSTTVYSVVWPDTERLIRRCMQEETDAMMALHRDAHTKKQDGLHEPFFEAWQRFSQSALTWNPDQFPEHYPVNGSSEAIREIIRQATWKHQDLVVFDGDYEGYEVMATMQGTRIHRVSRSLWREVLTHWRYHGVPWRGRGAQWWVSQPSALDGNVWPDFEEWLEAMASWTDSCQVWVDLTYVGRARLARPIDLTSPCVAGVVFSLSKVMGAYYRRIGGCFSRDPLPGLWGNRWFKNLDSLYLGQRWLEESPNALLEGARYRQQQALAIDRALQAMGGAEAWASAGVVWQASDVSLLMNAPLPQLPVPGALSELWTAAGRGRYKQASRRLCLTPALVALLEETPHVA